MGNWLKQEASFENVYFDYRKPDVFFSSQVRDSNMFRRRRCACVRVYQRERDRERKKVNNEGQSRKQIEKRRKIEGKIKNERKIE